MIFMLELIYLLIIFIGGFVGGFYGSTVGGGAIVNFPILLFVDLPPQQALGTQFVGGILLELASAIRFHKAKKLQLKLAVILGIFAGIGAVIGGTIYILIQNYSPLSLVLCFLSFQLFYSTKIGLALKH